MEFYLKLIKIKWVCSTEINMPIKEYMPQEIINN